MAGSRPWRVTESRSAGGEYGEESRLAAKLDAAPSSSLCAEATPAPLAAPPLPPPVGKGMLQVLPTQPSPDALRLLLTPSHGRARVGGARPRLVLPEEGAAALATAAFATTTPAAVAALAALAALATLTVLTALTALAALAALALALAATAALATAPAPPRSTLWTCLTAAASSSVERLEDALALPA